MESQFINTSNPQLKIDAVKMNLNQKKTDDIKTRFHDKFLITCLTGANQGESKNKQKKSQIFGRKDLTKILNYNNKRKEFIDEHGEEVIAELNFTMPNYYTDSVSAEPNYKNTSKKRRKLSDLVQEDVNLPDQVKLNAIKYYNNILDK
jgi:hypothetical protein